MYRKVTQNEAMEMVTHPTDELEIIILCEVDEQAGPEWVYNRNEIGAEGWASETGGWDTPDGQPHAGAIFSVDGRGDPETEQDVLDEIAGCLEVWVTDTQPQRPNTDSTGRRLFFQLLHKARALKVGGWERPGRNGYLLGMMRVMVDNHEDFRIADNMRDVWRHQQAQAH